MREPDVHYINVSRAPSLQKIERIWAFIAVSEEGLEGICGGLGVDGMWRPFIGADEERVKSLRPRVEDIVRKTGQPIKLVRFDQRTDEEEIGG